MPELPEVETVARELSPWERAKILKLEIFDPRVWFESESSPNEFKNLSLERVYRQGKYIVWSFGQIQLLQHLRMTGKNLPEGSPALPENIKGNPQVRARFRFADRAPVYFFDTRRFGTLTAIHSLEDFWRKKDLAPDPLHSKAPARTRFLAATESSSRPIKSLLLDQTQICGVGNIYADEALFAQRIHPLTPASSISRQKAEDLFEEVLRLFHLAITARGTSAFNYVGVNGQPGEFAKFLKVYQRKGSTCLSCGKDQIQATKISGRSSHFCPRCQPKQS